MKKRDELGAEGLNSKIVGPCRFIGNGEGLRIRAIAMSLTDSLERWVEVYRDNVDFELVLNKRKSFLGANTKFGAELEELYAFSNGITNPRKEVFLLPNMLQFPKRGGAEPELSLRDLYGELVELDV